MFRSFKYRLWTSPDQERELEAALETHRRLYNECLDWRQLAYECFKATLTYFDQTRWFTRAKETNPYYARINAKSAHLTMRRLDNTFQAFFRRVQVGGKPGYPRFKSKDRFNSIEFSANGGGAVLREGRLRVTNVGLIRIKLHRPIVGEIKTIRLIREASKWYVVFVCDLQDVEISPSVNPPIGIDVGLESFLTTSSGEQEPNPRYLKTALPGLRRRSRAVSRKKRGGSNRRKAVKKLAKVHARVKNLRREHHHHTALKLVRRYGLIAVESLNVQGMLKSGRLSRAIGDAGWSGFVAILKCKAERAGVQVAEVDPRGTSQECSGCGTVVRKALSVRRHDCPVCGLSLHRDVNAARNILSRALQDRTGPAGLNVGLKAERAPRSPSRKAKV